MQSQYIKAALFSAGVLGVMPAQAAPFEFSQVVLDDRVQITLSVGVLSDLETLLANDSNFDPSLGLFLQNPAGTIRFSDAWTTIPLIQGTANHDDTKALDGGFFKIIEDPALKAIGFLYALKDAHSLQDNFKLLSFDVSRPIGQDGVVSFSAFNFDVSSGYLNEGNLGAPLAQITVPAPVPEPQTYALFAAGLGLLGWVARRAHRV